MRIYTEKELADLGYKEVSPGVFARSAPTLDPNKKEKQKPAHLKHIKSGNYEVGGKIYHFRSGYEYTYACYLELLKTNKSIKNWEYEPKRFDFPIKRGCNSYLPDFKIIELDDSHYWVECKGYLDKKGATKIKRFAKYFPNERLEIVREAGIKEIRSKFGLK